MPDHETVDLSWPPGFGGSPPQDDGGLPERYTDRGFIAMGGHGEVRRVYDAALNREVVIKILRRDKQGRASFRHRFLREAELTARLQHPGVVPVHDRGVLADGRPWFTMREVEGRTLEEVIEAVHGASHGGVWRPTVDGWTLRRLVAALESVARIVAYAHDRDITHRDLKPVNIMVGPFGELLVMDWGIAKVHERDEPGVEEQPTADAPGQTRSGTVLGTLAYMAPEQAHGKTDEHGPPSDVYALGAILYHLLCGDPPYSGRRWEDVLAGPPVSLRERVSPWHPELPEALVELTEHAMARAPSDRPPSASALADRLRAWLEGTERRREALAMVHEADDLTEDLASLRARAAALRREARQHLARFRGPEPVDDKLPGWRLEQEAEGLELQAEQQEAGYERLLHAALHRVPELPEALDRLADLYKRRLVEARELRNARDIVRFRSALEAYDRGRHRSWMDGDGLLSLHTDPPGAEVELLALVEEDRRLVTRPERMLGTTPLDRLPLPHGSYLLRLRAAGHEVVDYPVRIERNGHWHGRPPGARQPFPVPLPPLGTLGPEERYVPPGWFLSGGDPLGRDELSRRRLWVDGFIVHRQPVTLARYLAFLNDLLRRGERERAHRHAPAHQPGAGQPAELAVRLGDDGLFQPGSLFGEQAWDLLEPVVSIDWESARAWAAWEQTQSSLPWRLPHDQEWEKAARGVDGRSFPWGDFLDPTWACMKRSHAGKMSWRRTADFPGDVGPYGVLGMAGNVRDWCSNPYDAEGLPDGSRVDPLDQRGDPSWRFVRGGAWTSAEDFCRLATRLVGAPHHRLTVHGARLVRSWGAAPAS